MPGAPFTQTQATLSDLREGVCRLNTSGLRLWRMAGKDAADYLQSQLTNDIKALGSGEGQVTTLLDRKGRLRALVTCWRLGGDYFFLGEDTCLSTLTQHLEAFHFTEDFRQTPLEEGALLAIAGPRALLALEQATPGLPLLATGLWAAALPGNQEPPTLVFSRPQLGEQVIYVWLPTGGDFAQLSPFFQAIPLLGPQDHETARVEAGDVKVGVDTTEKTLVAETGLEHVAVSYDKGCYLGQEVVARLKTYGTAPRGLMGLVWKNGPALAPGLALRQGDHFAGEITSVAQSPRFGPIALASLKKDWRKPGLVATWDTPQGRLSAEVRLLPFYQRPGAREEAQALYEKALDQFTGVSEEEAVALLRRAVALNPVSANAYEALGVILSRQGKLDEAIALMHRLKELNPEEVMAETNLSLYYMKKGLIQEAEDAKARATALQFKAAAKKAREVREEQARQSQEQEQLRERMAMFGEVLEMDPDDPLANFGLGGALLTLGQAAESIPYLQKSVQVQPGHSASYLALGKALSAAGRSNDAKAVFEKGIAVATQRGDLMPLKDMQLRLEKL